MTAAVTRLRAEYRREADGLGTPTPRLSWWVESSEGSQVWAEFERVGTDGDRARTRLDGDQQVLVEWPFEPLASRSRVEVRARVALSTGTVTSWSEPLIIETALLERSDWVVPLLVPSPTAPQEGPRHAWNLRAEFDLDDKPARARLYATAQGIYRAEINGQRVGDDELAPGWTSYDHRLRAQAYDVTALLDSGRNAIGVEIADGWFRGNIGFDGGVWDLYGPHVGIVAQLEVHAADGTTQIIDLDGAWRTQPSATVATGLYEGETFDARLCDSRWSVPGFDDTEWSQPEQRPLSEIAARIEHADRKSTRLNSSHWE